MNENINLCELLKGHEGETFYNSAYGKIKFYGIIPKDKNIIFHLKFIDKNNCVVLFNKFGKFSDNKDSEYLIFPSKDKRDWNKWAKEQKPDVPKTWRGIVNNGEIKHYHVNTYKIKTSGLRKLTPIEKSALALLKIHQLIEVGYGGNSTNEEWDNDNNYKYSIFCSYDNTLIADNTIFRSPIAFHTGKQAKEFLSYPENVQLVKDFYMI